MSWSFTLVGKPQDVAAKLREEGFGQYIPEGIKQLADSLAEKCDLPETRDLFIESNGHTQHRTDGKMEWGSGTLTFKTVDRMKPPS